MAPTTPSETETVEQFLALITINKSPTTVDGYGWELRHWLAAGGQLTDQTADLARYLAARRAGGISDSTLKRSLSALRTFFAWHRPADNPALAIPWPRAKRRKQRTLDDSEAMTVLSSCDTSTPKGIRDLCLLTLMLDTGLRAAEVCRLRTTDVDLAKRMLSVVVKGGDEKDGIFSAATGAYIARWLEVRWLFARPDAKTLFVSVNGETHGAALTPSGLRVIFRSISKRSGLDKPFSPHALRRSFATMATRLGAPARVLAVAGRWEDESMIRRYTATLTAADFEGYSPVENLLASPPPRPSEP